MGELLDPRGVWTVELVELMLPVAMEIEAEEAERTFGAVAAAAASLFDKKAPRAFREGIKRIRADVRKMQRRARGLEVSHEGTTPADAMMKIAERLKLKLAVPKPSRIIRPTHLHEGGPGRA